MRIAYFSDTFFPAINGVSSSIFNSIQGLAQLGHKILIIVPNNKDKSIMDKFHKNITIVWEPSISSYSDLRIGIVKPTTLLLVKKFKPNIIHVHSNLFLGGTGVMVAKLLKIPIIYTFHTYFMDPEAFKVVGINRDLKFLQDNLWAFARIFSRGANVIICPTDFVKKDLIEHRFTNRLEVIPSGINLPDLNNLSNKKEKIRKIFNIQGQTILGVGRLSKEKNWELLFDVFSKLIKKKNNIKLIIIGGGVMLKALRNRAKLLKIEKQVLFVGKIPHSELINDNYYLLGDIFVMPSSFETQGMVTLEAMSFGLPVIGVHSKGTISLVQNTGILVKPDVDILVDKIQQVFENKILFEDLSAKSLIRAKQFSTPAIIKKLENVYRSLLP